MSERVGNEQGQHHPHSCIYALTDINNLHINAIQSKEIVFILHKQQRDSLSRNNDFS